MAILKRKNPHGLLKKTKEMCWPAMGWRRTVSYFHHRLFRGGDSVHKITAGLCNGACVSFTPFLGTHILQGLLLSRLLRVSYLASVVGTLIGNPWSFPFIFWLTYKLGVFLSGFLGIQDFIAMPDAGFFEEPRLFLSFLFAHPLSFLLPMTIGGYICALGLWPLFYGVLYYPVRALRNAYAARKTDKNNGGTAP